MSKKKKGMKKNEKIVILVLVIILIAVIIFAVVRNSSSDTEETETSSSTESSETELESAGDYSVVLEDGTKLNTSTKLNEDKTLEGLEITDIQLTESEGVTQILATMTNTSDEVQGGYIATLTLLDEFVSMQENSAETLKKYL